MDGLQWKTLLKWMIWGYHYFWKHPYTPKQRWRPKSPLKILTLIPPKFFPLSAVHSADQKKGTFGAQLPTNLLTRQDFFWTKKNLPWEILFELYKKMPSSETSFCLKAPFLYIQSFQMFTQWGLQLGLFARFTGHKNSL